MDSAFVKNAFQRMTQNQRNRRNITKCDYIKMKNLVSCVHVHTQTHRQTLNKNEENRSHTEKVVINKEERDAWVAQTVKCPAQVMF